MYRKFTKRLIDFLISLLTMPFVLVVIIIISPVIWFDDRGPVFYNSTRRGMNGKTFKMFKFRTMYVNSPNLKNPDGSTFNSLNDPRVTRVGHMLRKTSLDEIPQIINVLLGQMSYIGPRPTLAIRPYEDTDPNTRKRYDVRPGITGYAQAYYRNSITQPEKFKIDCAYVDKMSFALDVKILIKTIMIVIKHDNVFVSIEDKPEEKVEVIE